MKIAVLTFVRQNSFGANLQCYALSRVLMQMGHEVEIIDFLLPQSRKSLIGRMGDRISRYIFSKFDECCMPPFTRHYITGAQLAEAPPQADCYIVGSDQVWNPDITKDSVTTFFLDFVPEGKRRVSYAASFGVESWQGTDQDELIRSSLSRFDAIGVREETGLQIIQNRFGLNGEVVLDPTLLLEGYSELVGPNRGERGELASFRLANDDRYLDSLAPLSRQLGLAPVLLNNRRYKRGFKYRPFMSIEGWLDSLANASLVVTDSFHCMVFSILFRRNFVVIPSHPGRTTRITGLLAKLGIEGRFFTDISMVDAKSLKPIPYDEVFYRLEVERTKSLNFLVRALGSAG